MHAMDLLKTYGLIFGTSICYTRANIDTVTSDKFLDMIIEKGCRYAWYFHYMPVGNDAAPELLPTPAQRRETYERIRKYRATKPLEMMQHWICFQQKSRENTCITASVRSVD